MSKRAKNQKEASEMTLMAAIADEDIIKDDKFLVPANPTHDLPTAERSGKLWVGLAGTMCTQSRNKDGICL